MTRTRKRKEKNPSARKRKAAKRVYQSQTIEDTGIKAPAAQGQGVELDEKDIEENIIEESKDEI